MTSINALISLLKYYAQLPYSTEKTSVLYADWNCDFLLEPDVSPVFFLFFFFYLRHICGKFQKLKICFNGVFFRYIFFSCLYRTTWVTGRVHIIISFFVSVCTSTNHWYLEVGLYLVWVFIPLRKCVENKGRNIHWKYNG